MIPPALLSTQITVKRRQSQGVDSLNNPIYGSPTDGTGWFTQYTNIPAKLAWSSKNIDFAKEGERLNPTGVVYINPGPVIIPEDRVLTPWGAEYVVTSVVPGNIGPILDHWECVIRLP